MTNIFDFSMFNLPNFLTAANLLSGIFSIVLTFAGRIELAPFAIFAGAIFDFLDGFAARKLKISSGLGKELDSLADMVSFGVAPGLWMLVVLVLTTNLSEVAYDADFHSFVRYRIYEWQQQLFYSTHRSAVDFVPFIAFLIPFFSMFRLAKFNLDTRQSDSFIGVPTPMNTIFFAFFPLMLWLNYGEWQLMEGIFRFIVSPYFISGLIIGMSLLLVAEIPVFSLKFKHFGWKGNEIRFIFLVVSVILIPLTGVWSIPLIVFLQLILSFTDALYLKNK